MSADEKVAPCVKRWLENFSLFNMKLIHMPGKLIPTDPLSRLHNLPSAVGSELNAIVDFEPRYPLPHPLDKIKKNLIHRISGQREGGWASLLRDSSEHAERVRISPEQPSLRSNNKFHTLRNHRIIQPPRTTNHLLPRDEGQVYLQWNRGGSSQFMWV